MTTTSARDPDRSGAVFLVERYLPAEAAENLAVSVSRAAQLCTLSSGSGSASEVHYMHSAYLPSEDTCFCLFRAATADAVRALNAEAEFALDRITAAILLHPSGPGTDQTDVVRPGPSPAESRRT